MNDWQQVAALDDIPPLGARVIKAGERDIALFRTAAGEVFALYDKCPHKGGPLSQGIVFDRKVACPLHGWTINLEDGHAVSPDTGCAGNIPCKVQDGRVFIKP